MKKNCFLLLFLLCACLVQAQDTYRTDKDVPYISGSETDAYRLERCKLDVYYPENKKDFSTIVWFHGGGLEGGGKHIPEELMNSYGERMLEQRSAQRLYSAFGRHLKYADGWKKYIISSEPEFEHYYGKQAVKKRKLYNGRLQCNVYMYY